LTPTVLQFDKKYFNNIHINNNNIYLTAIRLWPGGSG